MSSENLTSADNQQERLDCYITGFIDGEGCFTINFEKRKLKVGYYIRIVPEFKVSQNDVYVLELLKKRFDCGFIKRNYKKSIKDKSFAYTIRSKKDIKNNIIPFFNKNLLLTTKKNDFDKFKEIFFTLDNVENQHLLSKDNLKEIAEKAYTMNNSGLNRKRSFHLLITLIESSTTIR